MPLSRRSILATGAAALAAPAIVRAASSDGAILARNDLFPLAIASEREKAAKANGLNPGRRAIRALA